jgi:hypothetical protein
MWRATKGAYGTLPNVMEGTDLGRKEKRTVGLSKSAARRNRFKRINSYCHHCDFSHDCDSHFYGSNAEIQIEWSGQANHVGIDVGKDESDYAE